MSDPSAAYDRLRVETAEMLKLDVANLSLVEGLQLDLVSMLRLEVDGLQGAVLAGEQVDLGRLSTALGMLRQLLPEKSLVASPAAAPETRFGTNHRERLRQLIEETRWPLTWPRPIAWPMPCVVRRQSRLRRRARPLRLPLRRLLLHPRRNPATSFRSMQPCAQTLTCRPPITCARANRERLGAIFTTVA